MPEPDEQGTTEWDAARDAEKSIRDDAIAADIDSTQRLTEALTEDKSPAKDQSAD